MTDKEIINTGSRGEEIAIGHLASRGYRILEKNWRYGHKEIDIIASKNNMLIIVEVKSRSFLPLDDPGSLISRQKEKFLVEAAEAYILKHNIEMETRFDAIFISYNQDSHHLEHIEGAFIPTIWNLYLYYPC